MKNFTVPGSLAYESLLANAKGTDGYFQNVSGVPMRMFLVATPDFQRLACRGFPVKCDIGPDGSFHPNLLWHNN